MNNINKLNSILIADCGSTTTKVLLFEKDNNIFSLKEQSESPTTVEEPYNDVTVGLLNAFIEIERKSKRKLLKNNSLILPQRNEHGVDLFMSTSSAGGGLQILVAGVVKNMTAKSAEKAALGAGAIILDILSSEENDDDYKTVKKLQTLKPDMILMGGGTEGGTVLHLKELSHILQKADLKPRFKTNNKIPLIFAGNSEARNDITNILNNQYTIKCIDNIRPSMDTENIRPAKIEILNLFMNHVIKQAPGFNKLKKLTNISVLPTPAAVSNIIKNFSETKKQSVLCIDIGGATTDVFSYINNKMNRTVSANLGMSYSISNIFAYKSYNDIKRWLPFKTNKEDLQCKAARPVSSDDENGLGVP